MVFEGFAPAERHSGRSNTGSCGGQVERERVAQGERKRQRWSEKEREKTDAPGGTGISTRRETKGEVERRRRSSLRDLPIPMRTAWYVRTYTYTRESPSQLKTIDREKAAKYDATAVHGLMPAWNNNRDEEKEAHVERKI